ncbi:MAG: single-stranded DNA-binding protein [Bacteroidota bacterium]|nr:single-stranded DNA-binding protein [Bacteroidota bacterium]
MSVNKVILLGNLGKDPIVKKFDNGRAVAQFTMATSEKYKDKTGAQVVNTEWHNVVAWSPLAEIIEKYLKKGSQAYIEGRITSREYVDKDGVNRRITEIVARDLTLLGGPSSSSGGSESYAEPAYAGSKSAVPAEIASSPMDADNDLPF